MNNTKIRWLLIGIPYGWLLVLFLVPFAIVLKISLSDMVVARPPYAPLFDMAMLTAERGKAVFTDFLALLDFENYILLSEDALYWKAYLSSIKIATLATFFTLLIGFPIAYAIAAAPTSWRPALLILAILPFWISSLIRVYAWIGILSTNGFLNQLLIWLGLIETPFIIMNTDIAVYIGIVYAYLPFMVLPIYATLEKMDTSLLEAAEDLGCTRIQVFWFVTVPLARAGIIAGCFLVFIPALGEFVIPYLLGGSETLMIGKILWEEFFSNRDWPVASAVAIILLLILIVPLMLFHRNEARKGAALW